MTVSRIPGREEWRFVADVPGLDGRRRQVRRQPFPTKRSAAAAERALLAEVASGRIVHSGRLTVAQYLEQRWLPALDGDPKLKRTTVAGYRRMARHLVRGLGHVPLTELTGDHLTALYGRLRADGKAEGTVRYVHVTASRALKDARRSRLVAFNVAGDAVAPAPNPVRPRAWTPEQVATFLEHAATDRWWPLWRLAVTTGMRRGELCGLRWADFDLERSSVVVRNNDTVVEGHIVETTPKGRRARPMGLDPVTVSVLRDWRRVQAAERLVMAGDWPEHDRVFCWPDGSPVHPAIITNTYKRLRDRAGLPALHLHNVRHAWATSALLAGVPMKVVSDRLGHSSIQITGDVYTASVPALDAEAARTVADLYDRKDFPREICDTAVTRGVPSTAGQ